MSRTQKDNSTLARKVALRGNALRELGGEPPVIMETHGGYGEIFRKCYSRVKQGVVFEKSEERSSVLATQRPTWAVYEADCETALQAGCGSHLCINFLDVDPYGHPWSVFDAFFGSDRPRAERLVVVVNDGARRQCRMNVAWKSSEPLRAMAVKYGNDSLDDWYLDVCRAELPARAATAGYQLKRWTGYYCGFAKMMTHYAAVLER